MTKTIGKLINTIRVSRRLSLRDAAKELGMPPSYLSFIESNRQTPMEGMYIDALAKFIDVSREEYMSLAVQTRTALAELSGEDQDSMRKMRLAVARSIGAAEQLTKEDLQEMQDMVRKMLNRKRGM